MTPPAHLAAALVMAILRVLIQIAQSAMVRAMVRVRVKLHLTQWAAVSVTVTMHVIAQGAVGNNSCNGLIACFYGLRAVGDGSCNGENACLLYQCMPSYYGCSLPLAVGKNSCNGTNACRCPNPKGHTTVYQIGDGECNRKGDDFAG